MPRPSKNTLFSTAVQRYLNTAPRSKNTRVTVEKLSALFDGWLLDDINNAAVRYAIDSEEIVRSGASAATINRQIIVPISAIVNHAADEDLCEPRRFKRQRTKPGRVRWLTPEEGERLIEAQLDHHKTLVRFLLYSGARASEAIELEWPHVHLDQSFVEFVNTKTDVPRAAPINSDVVNALASLPHREGRVFRLGNGEPIHTNGRTHGIEIAGFRRATERSGIVPQRYETFTPHDCRHTWATWLYNETLDPIRLRTYGGWASIQMVERYAHIVPEHVSLQAGVLPTG